MSLHLVAFGPQDTWIRVTTDGITWSGGLPTTVYNLLNGRYNKGQQNSPLVAFDMSDDDDYWASYKDGNWRNHISGQGPDITTFAKIDCVTFGSDSSSYIIISDSIHYRGIPKRAAELIQTRTQRSLQWAALGYGGSYFLLFSDGAYYWGGPIDSSLESEIENNKKRIKKLFLSASSDSMWTILWSDGSTTWSADAPTKFRNVMISDKWMSPDNIAYLQSSINSEFCCGRSIEETALSLRNKEIDVDDIPCITVVKHEGITYSLNNRRLWAFKQSGIDSIPVIIGKANAAFKKQLHNRLYNDIHVR